MELPTGLYIEVAGICEGRAITRAAQHAAVSGVGEALSATYGYRRDGSPSSEDETEDVIMVHVFAHWRD